MVKGLYSAGAWPNLKTFKNALSHCLKPGKRVEANDGYVRRADKVKCPKNDCNPAKNRGMHSAERSRHETLNRRLKNWGILEKVYRHDITVHGTVIYTCAVTTQLSVTNGEPLVEVQYGNK